MACVHVRSMGAFLIKELGERGDIGQKASHLMLDSSLCCINAPVSVINKNCGLFFLNQIRSLVLFFPLMPLELELTYYTMLEGLQGSYMFGMCIHSPVRLHIAGESVSQLRYSELNMRNELFCMGTASLECSPNLKKTPVLST